MAGTDWFSMSSGAKAWMNAQGRSVSVGNIIADDSISIVIRRRTAATQSGSVVTPASDTTLPAQTVRIVTRRAPGERVATGDNALVKSQEYVLLGYKDHPTITDTDVHSDDTFAAYGQKWRVIKVEAGLPDHIEATIEAIE